MEDNLMANVGLSLGLTLYAILMGTVIVLSIPVFVVIHLTKWFMKS